MTDERAWFAIGTVADSLNDFESLRIQTANRLRAMRDDKGLADTAEEFAVVAALTALEATEHGLELALKRGMRQHSLGPWCARTKGIGEKTLARFLACIGDPSWHSRDDRPRRLGELNALVGMHVLPADHSCRAPHRTDVGGHLLRGGAQRPPVTQTTPGTAPQLRRGQQSNWNNEARKRLWIIASRSITHMDAAHRHVYDAGRAQYAEAVHGVECKRCGPSGKPAPVGSDLSDGHKHGRALRLVMKQVLRDLWIEARRLRGLEGGESHAFA